MKLRHFLIRWFTSFERLLHSLWMVTQLPLAPVAAENFVQYSDWFARTPAGGGSSGVLIPRRVFISWRRNEFGRAHRNSLEALFRLNPGWQFIFLDDEDLARAVEHCTMNPVLRESFVNANFGQIKADIARIVILNHFGGVWIDASKGISAPLDEIFALPSSVLTYERNISTFHLAGAGGPLPLNVVANWAFGLQAESRIGGLLFDGLVANLTGYDNRVQEFVKPAIVSLTGPGLFTKTIQMNYSSDVHLIGIDFNGAAQWELKGSRARYGFSKPYAEARFKPLFRAIAATGQL